MDAVDWLDQLDAGDGLPVGEELEALLRDRSRRRFELELQQRGVAEYVGIIHPTAGSLHFESSTEGAAVREAMAFLEDCLERLRAEELPPLRRAA